MIEAEQLIDLFLDNIKSLLYPENWLQMDLKFSKSEIFAMLLIDKRDEITMTELAEYINAPMSTANGIVERLVKKDCVARDRSDLDRRVVVLRLTEQGTQLIMGLKELIAKYMKAVIEDLSAEEMKSLVDIILKIVRSLQNKFSAEHPSEPAENEMKNIVIE